MLNYTNQMHTNVVQVHLFCVHCARTHIVFAVLFAFFAANLYRALYRLW